MARKQRGRPLKFGRPARLLALTLPHDVVAALRRIHPDPAWAIVSLYEKVAKKARRHGPPRRPVGPPSTWPSSRPAARSSSSIPGRSAARPACRWCPSRRAAPSWPSTRGAGWRTSSWRSSSSCGIGRPIPWCGRSSGRSNGRSGAGDADGATGSPSGRSSSSSGRPAPSRRPDPGRLLAGAAPPPARRPSSSGITAKARTGNVPNARTFTGTAKKRKPASGSWSRPRRCSTIGMSAAKQERVRGAAQVGRCRRC